MGIGMSEALGRSTVTVERFATGELPPTARLSYWNDLASQTFTGLAIDTDLPQSFSASLERINFGAFSLAEVAADASVVRHTREHARHDEERPHFLLHLLLSGTSVNSQAGIDAKLNTGDFALCDTTRPYQLIFNESTTFLVVRFPANEFRRHFPMADDAAGLRVPGRSGRTALLRSFLQSLRSEAMIAGDEDWEGLTSVCAEFVSMCMQPWVTPGTISNFRSEREVVESVKRHFRKPDIGVHDIARDVGMSVRNVQKIFAARCTTPSLYILRQRLNEAARILEQTDIPVTAIAMDLGFNDLSYFSRSFRNVFGKTPTQYRNRFHH